VLPSRGSSLNSSQHLTSLLDTLTSPVFLGHFAKKEPHNYFGRFYFIFRIGFKALLNSISLLLSCALDLHKVLIDSCLETVE